MFFNFLWVWVSVDKWSGTLYWGTLTLVLYYSFHCYPSIDPRSIGPHWIGPRLIGPHSVSPWVI